MLTTSTIDWHLITLEYLTPFDVFIQSDSLLCIFMLVLYYGNPQCIMIREDKKGVTKFIGKNHRELDMLRVWTN